MNENFTIGSHSCPLLIPKGIFKVQLAQPTLLSTMGGGGQPYSVNNLYASIEQDSRKRELSMQKWLLIKQKMKLISYKEYVISRLSSFAYSLSSSGLQDPLLHLT